MWASGGASTELVWGVPFFCALSDKTNHLKIMEIIREKTIAFTGNRILTSSNGITGQNLRSHICQKLYNLLEEEYLNNGIINFMSGFAIGFDLLAASVILELKKKYSDIKLIAVIPFRGQEQKYSIIDKEIYREILLNADKEIVISQCYTSNDVYHKRNDYLIANSSKIIAYHNGMLRSGTSSTIRKAKLLGVEIMNIYE